MAHCKPITYVYDWAGVIYKRRLFKGACGMYGGCFCSSAALF